MRVFLLFIFMSSAKSASACDPRFFPSPDGLQEDGGVRQLSKTLRQDVWEKPKDQLKMAVPACLYVVQNNLNYIAVSNLDGPTFQLLYQLKILTTALFSVFMLKR